METRREAITLRAQLNGKEKVDTTPVEIPIDADRPLSLKEQIQLCIRQEMSQQATRNGLPSFAEEDDFDLDEDEEWTSPYEMRDLQPDAEPGDHLETIDGPPDPEPPPETEETTELATPGGNEDQEAP